MNALAVIPSVGKSIAADLNGIGIHNVTDLNGKDPEVLYRKICDTQGMVIDRCLLYVMRCAVYYASYTHHESEKLKWWKWKD